MVMKSRLATVLLLALVVSMWASQAAWAATITVDTTNAQRITDSQCSLREAIINANRDNQAGSTDCAAGSGIDTIIFDLGSSATITLGRQLDITDAERLTIDGGAADITVSGNDKVRVFQVAEGARLALTNLTVSDGLANDSSPFNNRGGGVENSGGNLTITNSTFSGNTSTFLGGAIATQNIGDRGGTVKVKNSTFSGNSAGNSGGGLYILGATTSVTNSTFSGNSAPAGGGINNSNFSTLTVTNSTFSENGASNNGGAITHGGSQLTVESSTFAANSSLFGNSIFNLSAANSATLRNTILASAGANCAVPPGEPITDGGYNIDNGTSCGFSASTSKSTTDPKLDPLGLQNNGGRTQTIALQEDSPAIDQGNSFGLNRDQRGESRPQDFAAIANATGGDGSDIGAFEVQP
jgi:predicted outer membrane repeat protein